VNFQEYLVHEISEKFRGLRRSGRERSAQRGPPPRLDWP
jgi:hypothetical protein